MKTQTTVIEINWQGRNHARVREAIEEAMEDLFESGRLEEAGASFAQSSIVHYQEATP